MLTDIMDCRNIVIYDPVSGIYLDPREVVAVDVPSGDYDLDDVHATFVDVGYSPLYIKK